MLALSLLHLSSSSSKPSPFDLLNPRLFPVLPGAISIVGPDLPCRSRLPHRRFRILRSRSEMEFHVNADRGCHKRGLEIDADRIVGVEDLDLPVDICATRVLPSALSLAAGFDKIKVAVEEFKVNPPRTRSGVMRFQVEVPPSTKASNWLCCQNKDLLVYPQFYLTTTSSTVEMKRPLEVCGIGVAVIVHGFLFTPQGSSLISRYLSIDSPLIRAYGFLGNYIDGSLLVEMLSSYFLCIPQFVVEEHMGCSILAATLVWDDHMLYTFADAINAFEINVHQMRYYIPQVSTIDKLWMNHADKKSPLVGKKDIQMVFLNAELLAGWNFSQANNNIQEIMDSHGSICLAEDYANINTVWASLIVEECVRLGLTYFCIAPGSRSSPLAIAACRHPYTTCFSSYDERSLAFHAVGYAKGSHKPAVVITSSGTAVSNLLPAVVEAHHDFTPLILLTADRPPELHDAGANQSIDQVNHFGKFAKFFGLPAAMDQVPVRMILTTIDSALHYATQVPFGPVHINCPFREPLEDSPKEWTIDCLKGLDSWFAKTEPYTKYITMQLLFASNNCNSQLAEVTAIIQRAERGLLLIGAIENEDEIFASSLLVKHLSWPVVCDIMSGLRLRRVLSSFSEMKFLFIDHMDHALLSDSVRSWAHPDVVLQLGRRITSKRISQFLEFCSPSSYILVDKFPCRHDPSHIVTHRVQSTIIEFTHILQKIQFPRQAGRWRTFLNKLNAAVAQEIEFQIYSKCFLTEPYVAHVIGEVLNDDTSLFIGNSMVIRDIDMYGKGWLSSMSYDYQTVSNLGVEFQGFRVAGNRGASGIDGVLSTAVGFAVGCNKHVLCLIGDVSFLHDTNGLAILNERVKRKPLTVVVINNHGGGIFSLLPVAERANPDVLNKFFYTCHNISIERLCTAHSVKHFLVRTMSELQNALSKSQHEQYDCVIEVESSIVENANFHRIINKFSSEAANKTLNFLLTNMENRLFTHKIHKVEYSLYRIQLCAPLTSSLLNGEMESFFHEGFILRIYLDNNIVGLGEVAPIEIHAEDLLDVEEQLRFLVHKLVGSNISFIPLLRGSFSEWIWRSLAIPASSIFPSVKCGLEMAILNTLAMNEASSFFDVISGYGSSSVEPLLDADGNDGPKQIEICALIDHSGSPKEIADVVYQLVDEGFNTIKLKVARRKNPLEDVEVIRAIRQVVGYKINIRVDANRKWTYEEALQFGSCVKHFNLQFIEEPVNREMDILKFCDESSLPVALDETIDNLKGDLFHGLKKFAHPGIVAIVIKPSVIGGFENAATVAKWAQLHKKIAIVSSAFESSVSLSVYIQFAYYLERQNAAVCKIEGRELNAALAHGLGTYRWLKEDVTSSGIDICMSSDRYRLVASVEKAENFLKLVQINKANIQKSYSEEQTSAYQTEVDGEFFSCSFKFLKVGQNLNNRTVVFLHGFLGTSEEWIPIIRSISASVHCISIDLPGHGESKLQSLVDKSSKQRLDLSVESVANILLKLISGITSGKVILVGYSMGARIALNMAVKYKEKVIGAVIISGSPGLRNETTKRIRVAQDEAKANFLVEHGLECFLDLWYSGILWRSLRGHPNFSHIKSSRSRHKDIQGLANVLSSLSVGKQLSLWDDLKHLQTPLLFIVGEKDTKFREIAQQMCSEIKRGSIADHHRQRKLFDTIVVPDCGHAVHLENPLCVINAVRKFVERWEQK
ncbi:protein PHYLLO, chloroplastic-like isoform X2 [Zingiber officinale]|uniref:protein PHYLLO, chloroplastic-like isoform X2 n=1 Tax=Zingiber officinale TaxID=94328 RepID=UPI001C4BADE3|nr:protein PHYLLO, chloroplastic-like isoform X2 [Zingiber officinale]